MATRKIERAGIIAYMNDDDPYMTPELALKLEADRRTRQNQSAMFEAVHKGDLKTLRDSIHKGANVNAIDDSHLPRLNLNFMEREMLYLAKAFSGESGEEEENRCGGNTPLHNAVKFDLPPESIKIVKCLLDAGAKVNARDNSGRTALFKAVHLCDRVDRENQSQNGKRKIDMVEILLDAGADASIRNNDGVCITELVSFSFLPSRIKEKMKVEEVDVDFEGSSPAMSP